MKKYFLLTALITASTILVAQEKVLDEFETLDGWKTFASDGVETQKASDAGVSGKAIRIDVEYKTGAGYGGVIKSFPISLPGNYQFSFYVRAEMSINNFEIKFSDTTGNIVWWTNKRNFTFPTKWKKITIKKRHIEFAWGPSSAPLTQLGHIEFTITAGTGGKGSVYIDHLTFEKLDDEDTTFPPLEATASSSASKRTSASNAIDNSVTTLWQSKGSAQPQWLTIDCGRRREFGGLIIDWGKEKYAASYNILLSLDNKKYDTAYSVSKNRGVKNYIYLPESEARYIKVVMNESNRKGFTVRNIEIASLDFSSNMNNFYQRIAHDAPRGLYPKYFTPQASYWTIFGASGDTKEGMINEDGMFEVDKGSFSIEPFVFADGKLMTWNDVSCSQQLERNYLPIPSVVWKSNTIELTTKVFAEGEAGTSSIYAWYRLKNSSSAETKGNLYLAVRPFQVNPPYQFLNMESGAMKISSLSYNGENISVNKNNTIVPFIKPDNVGVASFEEGDITSYLKNNMLPQNKEVSDAFEHASGAMQYAYTLKSNETKDIVLAIPFHGLQADHHANIGTEKAVAQAQKKLDETIAFWESKVSNIDIMLPKSDEKIINTLKSTLAYILINRDGAATQPGSRSYERSWIRDGSMTSAVLLRMGDVKEVREYLDWYAKYQFPNGKIPCVVDTRGPDATPENDSHGQFIYAVLQYFYFTHDTTFLREKFKNIAGAVEYIQTLRAPRLIDYYKNGSDSLRALYGLVTESISHEGYSDKPMHSYWDDLFTMRGLKDAATIAHIIGNKEYEAKFLELRDEFRAELNSSILLSMKYKHINYIPGCVEKGDFDATSTAVGLYPVEETHSLPQEALNNTFEKYYTWFVNRIRDTTWVNYTPYEIRVCGSMIRLGYKERAHAMLNWFFHDQRPRGWNHWAEVVWHDATLPRFIGDMPHTWVGSDYVGMVRTMFAYEDGDSVLVLGAGLKDEWFTTGNAVSVKKFPTYFGELNFSAATESNTSKIEISGAITFPKNGILFTVPRLHDVKKILVGGKEIVKAPNINVKVVPTKITIEY